MANAVQIQTKNDKRSSLAYTAVAIAPAGVTTPATMRPSAAKRSVNDSDETPTKPQSSSVARNAMKSRARFVVTFVQVVVVVVCAQCAQFVSC